MGLFGRKNKNEKSQEEAQDNFTPAANMSRTQASVEDAGDDELIAVIMAAISASLGSESKLVIRRITRVGDTTPLWGHVGRHEQMLNRL